MTERTLRGKVAVAGIGETTYYKRGGAEDAEFVLALKAILAACEDAGIDPREVDGFASYSNDRNDPSRISAALGIKELKFANMQWGGGGGGGSGAVANAAAAVATGVADCVVVFRALAQGQFARFGQGPKAPGVAGEPAYTIPYGMMSPAQMFAMRCTRHLHETGVTRDTYKAVSLATYAHAQNNPRAVMYGRPLTPEKYDEARWIVEPYQLYDCCMENDGAAALVIVSADRAKDLKQKPAYLLGATAGSEHRNGAPSHNAPLYATSSFTSLAPRLYEMAGVGPKDVDVLQSYENFTGGVVMSIIEHGFCSHEEANEFLTYENLLAKGGKLPLNTSGGNLAECYMHGLELITEAVRQIRGESPNQVENAKVAMVTSGPMVTPVSNSIFGSEEVL
ncbi:MAG TPA: acetyl-CoA acetyltransferase [Alphaproteobacteria bacterium]|nr:acetyl-CoA acetyltransferase [Alphaproteobacteria bacterium]HBA44148.1 acetyl-CoA acetyltransferase [Alphaproteobacteria bacterium]HBC53289.1 acetyl-CoA acetyltransferase [Alphaproteobacteria bacterium]HBF97785.1 acetyl-CoA acetyltransferase [Alphaproteobacteria bacterium]